jgi:hypothetical protein
MFVTLLNDIANDPATPKQPGITEAQLVSFIKKWNAPVPEVYIEFLKKFGSGEEFIFARMIDVLEKYEPLEDQYGDYQHINNKKVLPFGDDWGGNFYCFDLEKISNGNCPIAFVDHELKGDPELEHIADSFEEFFIK